METPEHLIQKLFNAKRQKIIAALDLQAILRFAQQEIEAQKVANGIKYYRQCRELNSMYPALIDNEEPLNRDAFFLMTNSFCYRRRWGWDWHNADMKEPERN